MGSTPAYDQTAFSTYAQSLLLTSRPNPESLHTYRATVARLTLNQEVAGSIPAKTTKNSFPDLREVTPILSAEVR